jgi:hypothetical protein
MSTTWSNVLRGCAYGDAWGHTNEFRSYAGGCHTVRECLYNADDAVTKFRHEPWHADPCAYSGGAGARRRPSPPGSPSAISRNS